jgi:ADP-ribose pyrophosphatase YjhB (NUDIX family)
MNQQEWEASVERVGVVVGCLVKENDRYLMVQENQDSARGLWNLPAGHVDKGESLEDAAVRETKEETGLAVRLIAHLAIYHEAASKSVKHVFGAEVVGGGLKAQEGEILDVGWLTYDQIEEIQHDGKIRAPWVWDVIVKDHESS